MLIIQDDHSISSGNNNETVSKEDNMAEMDAVVKSNKNVDNQENNDIYSKIDKVAFCRIPEISKIGHIF